MDRCSGTPRAGGEFIFTVNADPPSWDIHQESTWATLYPTQGHYNLLVRFSQTEYPKIDPEVAESWTISADGLVYDFIIRNGIAFHDGSILTSRDVKASYDHIINPPQGVLSPRKALYTSVESVEAPDPHTVRFKLKYPTASFMLNVASPWNHIYKADILAQDPHALDPARGGSGDGRQGNRPLSNAHRERLHGSASHHRARANLGGGPASPAAID